MNGPFFSIIVPIYNVEKYLQECLDSILEQNFKDYELILVDDGSPDNCPAICEAYAEKDNRIKVIHKQNGGLSSARNAGLDIVKGKYILFCDSDDFYLPGAFAQLYSLLCKKDFDVVYFGYKREFIDGVIDVIPKQYEGEITEQLLLSIAYAGFVPTDCAVIDVMVWNKVYNARIMLKENMRFDESMRIAEDITFNVPYFVTSDNVCCIDAALYFYRLNLKSLSHDDKGFAEKGMERSVYFLSTIQHALERKVSVQRLYPVAKARYNRIVIDACSVQQRRKRPLREMLQFIRNCIGWYREYLEFYDVDMSNVSVSGIKAKLEDFLISHECVFMIYLYTKAMFMYHGR